MPSRSASPAYPRKRSACCCSAARRPLRARAALVHQRLQPEARSDAPPARAGRRRPQTGTRAHAALQHHQRGQRPDSPDRHRRAPADRERARADAVHRVGGGKRGAARRRPHEQHAAVLGAVEQGDRGNRRHPARAAAGQPGRRVGPGVRAAEHGDRGSAAGQRRRVDSAQRHRPAPRERRDRRELSQDAHRGSAGARRKRSLEPDHRLGGRPDRRDRRGRRDVADERARPSACSRFRPTPARSSSAGCRPTTRISRRSSPACWSAPTSAASAKSA